MKKLIFSIGFMLCLVLAGKSQETTVTSVNPNAPEIVFETEIIDYGNIEKGSDGSREFKFKNAGKEPLIISGASGSCGCTVPTAPLNQPFKPGESGSIKVKYDTERVGAFEKTVTITSNAKTSTKVIKIKGVVKDPQAPATPAQQPAPAKPGK